MRRSSISCSLGKTNLNGTLVMAKINQMATDETHNSPRQTSHGQSPTIVFETFTQGLKQHNAPAKIDRYRNQPI